MYADKYAEHLAHSAPCASRWDGFDRGDVDHDDNAVTETVVGRVTRPDGKRVEIIEVDSYRLGAMFVVKFDGASVHSCDTRAEAVTVGRWWVAGCPQ